MIFRSLMEGVYTLAWPFDRFYFENISSFLRADHKVKVLKRLHPPRKNKTKSVLSNLSFLFKRNEPLGFHKVNMTLCRV